MKTSLFLMLASATVAGAIGAGTILQNAIGKGPLTETDWITAGIAGGLLFFTNIQSYLAKSPTQG